MRSSSVALLSQRSNGLRINPEPRALRKRPDSSGRQGARAGVDCVALNPVAAASLYLRNASASALPEIFNRLAEETA